jgi:hypothetical protein
MGLFPNQSFFDTSKTVSNDSTAVSNRQHVISTEYKLEVDVSRSRTLTFAGASSDIDQGKRVPNVVTISVEPSEILNSVQLVSPVASAPADEDPIDAISAILAVAEITTTSLLDATATTTERPEQNETTTRVTSIRALMSHARSVKLVITFLNGFLACQTLLMIAFLVSKNRNELVDMGFNPEWSLAVSLFFLAHLVWLQHSLRRALVSQLTLVLVIHSMKQVVAIGLLVYLLHTKLSWVFNSDETLSLDLAFYVVYTCLSCVSFVLLANLVLIQRRKRRNAHKETPAI